MYHTKNTLCQFVRNRIRFPFLIINREMEKRKRKFETRSTLLVSPRRNTRRETGHFVPIPRRIKRGVKAYPSKTCGYFTLLIYDLLRDSYVHTRVYRPFLTETDKQGWENHRARLLDPFFRLYKPYCSNFIIIIRIYYYHSVELGLKIFLSNLKSLIFIPVT